MTAQDRQKLAETEVKNALNVLYTAESGEREADDAINRATKHLEAALAQPCQKCVRLEAEVERWERQQIRPQEIIDRLLAAEAEVAALRERLAKEVAAEAISGYEECIGAVEEGDITLPEMFEAAIAHRNEYRRIGIARRALSADPLVCRDPDLCWGKGTCPRDPACNE